MQVSTPVNVTPDLVDTLALFKNILDVKLGDLKSGLNEEHDRYPALSHILFA
jgi:hypothetical protein